MGSHRPIRYLVTLAIFLGLISWLFQTLILNESYSSLPLDYLKSETPGATINGVVHGPSNAILSYRPETRYLKEPLRNLYLPLFSFALAILSGLSGFNPFKIVFFTILTTSSFILLFGNDPIVYGAIAIAPFLTLSTTRYLRSGSLIWLLLLFYLLLKNQVFAGSLFAHTAVFSWLLVGIIIIKPRGSIPPEHSTRFSVLLFCSALAILFLYFKHPALPTFDLPSSATLIPDDGLPGIIRPLIGNDYFTPTVDISWAKRSLMLIAFAGVLGAGLVILSEIRSRGIRAGLYYILALSLALFIDSIPNNYLSNFGPIGSISRIVPGLALFPLSYFFASAIIFGSVYLILSYTQALPKLALSLPLIPLIVAGTLGETALQNTTYMDFIREISGPRNNSEHPAKINSPSLWVLMHYPQIHPISDQDNLRFTDIPIANCELAGMRGDCQSITDGDFNTRISSSPGGRKGWESITVRLSSIIKISGLRLSLGKLYSDFPGGLTISDCSLKDGQASSTAITPWIGPIRATESGYPFIGKQSDVSIKFKTPWETSCLQVLQTSAGPFDWSVAELSYLPAI